jgi:hypothetical protein
MKGKTQLTAARGRKVQTQKWRLMLDIKKLARDPEWEALEVRAVAHITKNLPPFPS